MAHRALEESSFILTYILWKDFSSQWHQDKTDWDSDLISWFLESGLSRWREPTERFWEIWEKKGYEEMLRILQICFHWLWPSLCWPQSDGVTLSKFLQARWRQLLPRVIMWIEWDNVCKALSYLITQVQHSPCL